MKLAELHEEIFPHGTLSFVGGNPGFFGDIIVYLDDKAAYEGYKEAVIVIQKDLGSGYTVVEAETENGFHLVSIVEADAVNNWNNTRFIAFGPTLKSCAKATEKIMGEIPMGQDRPAYLQVEVA